MKPDPTRTKVHMRNYESRIKRLVSNFKKFSFPRLIRAINRNKSRLETNRTHTSRNLVFNSAISEIEGILNEEEYNQIRAKAKQVARRYTKLTYQKGSKKAAADIKKLGINDYIYLPAPVDFEAIEVMIDNNFRLVTGATVDMKKHMLRVISTGMLEGQSMQKMVSELSKRVDITKGRVSVIVQTETIRNYAQSSINQYKKAGIHMFEWIAAADERTCEECMGLDGRVFKMGSMQPPAHPRCRCAVAPVIKEAK